MIRILISLVISASVALGVDWAPPAVSQGAWTAGAGVGVDGGMLQYVAGGASDRAVTGTVRNVTQAPYSVNSAGTASATSGVQAAIDASAPGDVVYFPAGTYRFDSEIVIDRFDSGITLRGAGPGLTTFVANSGGGGKMINFVAGGDRDTTQTVTGTKTKGTTALTVANTAPFTAGAFCHVYVSNEENNTRIQAGAIPTWSNQGFRELRRIYAKIISVGGGQVTIDPGLPWDCTLYTVTLAPETLPDWFATGVGLEDFSITFIPSAQSAAGINIYQAQNCWIYKVHSASWAGTSNSGQVINAVRCYKLEIRKCKFVTPDPAASSDDGAIQLYSSSGVLIVDNIMVGFDTGIYEFGNVINSVYAYNYIDAGFKGVVHHNFGSTLVLLEGNILTNWQSDGYHGYASNNGAFRNWFTGEGSGANIFMVSLNRFTRQNFLVGNVVGENGRQAGVFGFGNPNIGNGDFSGTVQPTAGTFWADWGMTGTLTTRTSDTSGVVTMNKGDFVSTTGGGNGSRLTSLWWNSFGSKRMQMNIVGVSGLAITLSGGSGDVLPAQGTTFSGVWTFAAGYQELDLDVAASTTQVENYLSSASGTGSIANPTSDVLPNSLVFASKPIWFGNLTWPAINPDSPTFTGTQIPAGYRYFNSDADPPPESGDITAPTPNPMTFSSVPAAVSSASVAMTASLASDAGGGIMYYFAETSGHAGGSDSGWQSSRDYTDSGLTASTLYTYRVKARDASLNETTLSTAADATTSAATGGGTVNIETINVTNLRVGQ